MRVGQWQHFNLPNVSGADMDLLWYIKPDLPVKLVDFLFYAFLQIDKVATEFDYAAFARFTRQDLLKNGGKVSITLNDVKAGTWILSVVLVNTTLNTTNSEWSSAPSLFVPIPYSVLPWPIPLCPNMCGTNGHTLKCNNGGCICANGYTGQDCSIFKHTLLGEDRVPSGVTPLLIRNQWHYFELILTRPISDIFLSLQVYKNAPVSIYLRQNKMPSSINFDTKLDVSNVDWDGITKIAPLSQYLALKRTIPMSPSTWYIGIQQPLNVSLGTSYDFQLTLESVCPEHTTCTCEDKNKIGPNCEYDFQPIQPSTWITKTVKALEWQYFWFSSTNTSVTPSNATTPLVFHVSEIYESTWWDNLHKVKRVANGIGESSSGGGGGSGGSSDNQILMGMVSVYVMKDGIPDYNLYQYADLSMNQIHTIQIPSDSSNGNWTIGVVGNNFLGSTATVKYRITVYKGCSIYTTCEACTKDRACGWCQSYWNVTQKNEITSTPMNMEQNFLGNSKCYSLNTDTCFARNFGTCDFSDSKSDLKGRIVGGVIAAVIMAGVIGYVVTMRRNPLNGDSRFSPSNQVSSTNVYSNVVTLDLDSEDLESDLGDDLTPNKMEKKPENPNLESNKTNRAKSASPRKSKSIFQISTRLSRDSPNHSYQPDKMGLDLFAGTPVSSLIQHDEEQDSYTDTRYGNSYTTFGLMDDDEW
eukprot:TRINITY_DN598_c1_g1_i2.p1 TRINITY_DN598_c1_g1~~TRINITY_DN598_c1_g1_i2.p1  ORF type:complete len:696 (+),score=130.55 TRINITY_DN598_c1_g1_i2:657-2744(+)